MTIDEANAVVAALTYKPGWSLELGQCGALLQLRLEMCAPNARSALREEVDIISTAALDPHLLAGMSERAFLGWVFGQIMALERHEAWEWFRYRGDLVADPHAT